VRPFKFRLATVLSVWQKREEAAFAVFQRESAAVAAAKADVDRRVAARLDAQRAAATAWRAPDGAAESAWHRNWITHLTVEIDAARGRAARCEARERDARAVWQRARRDRRVMERLRDRAQARHAAETRRVELVEMNERAGLMDQARRGQHL
jgi:flagellar export protein FliJ